MLWGRVESWFISFSGKHFSNLSVVLVQTENLFVNTIQGIYLASVLDSLQRINNPNSLRFTNRTLKKRKITKESEDLLFIFPSTGVHLPELRNPERLPKLAEIEAPTSRTSGGSLHSMVKPQVPPPQTSVEMDLGR